MNIITFYVTFLLVVHTAASSNGIFIFPTAQNLSNPIIEEFVTIGSNITIEWKSLASTINILIVQNGTGNWQWYPGGIQLTNNRGLFDSLPWTVDLSGHSGNPKFDLSQGRIFYFTINSADPGSTNSFSSQYVMINGTDSAAASSTLSYSTSQMSTSHATINTVVSTATSSGTSGTSKSSSASISSASISTPPSTPTIVTITQLSASSSSPGASTPSAPSTSFQAAIPSASATSTMATNPSTQGMTSTMTKMYAGIGGGAGFLVLAVTSGVVYWCYRRRKTARLSADNGPPIENAASPTLPSGCEILDKFQLDSKAVEMMQTPQLDSKPIEVPIYEM